MTNKIYFTSKAELIDPSNVDSKAIANSLSTKYGFNLKPQMDLFYVRSCLVTAGETHGVNDNDDVFTREQTWAARHTPVLKPANWQHNDKDILGVVYSVEARDLNGNTLDINSEEVPSCEFELWTEAAIFSLIHPEKAEEIVSRARAGTLHVSMEAFFDDYNYGLSDKATGSFEEILRTSDTKFLDLHLRAKGGQGFYKGKSVVRVLKDMTFGGYGFVDVPANKRSIIDDVSEILPATASDNGVDRFLREVSKFNLEKEDCLMAASAGNDNHDNSKSVGDAIAKALDTRDKAAAEKAHLDSLEGQIANLKSAKASLEGKVETLESAFEEKDSKIEALENEMVKLDEVVEAITKAGATSDVPAEIAKIDNTEDKFSAKIAFINTSVASLGKIADLVPELEKSVATSTTQVRTAEVKAMFRGLMKDEEIAALVAVASKLTDDASYQSWRSEKMLFATALDQASAVKDDEKKVKKSEKKTEKEEASFEDLVRARMEGLINHPGGEDVTSGVSSESLKTPRFRIAANINQGDDVNLAGASMVGSDDSKKTPDFDFSGLAKAAAGVKEEVKKDDVKPGFDPVN